MGIVDTTASSVAPSRQLPAACTIITRNYLSHAKILADSYLRHEPGSRFYLLVLDGLPEEANVRSDVVVVGPDELQLPSFFEMCFKYDVVELCTAVKPSFLSLLLERFEEEAVIYFDPDILVMRPLDELKQALASANIVLIPHLLEPIPLDGRRPSEQDILLSGTYNLGFVAVRKSDEGCAFLRWWNERLQDGCRVDPARGIFVDQKWVDLIPGFFSSTSILRDETYNVAYWNLHSRHVERSGNTYLVNGRPLAFFHFSGFDPSKRSSLSKHQNRIKVVKGTGLADLLNCYADLQMQHGYQTSSKWGYGYNHFDNGIAVNPILRQLYLDLDVESRKRFGNPFCAGGAHSFLNWAVRPRADGNLSPFLLRLYQMRPDLAAAFPDVRRKDRDAFLHWARTQGAREMGYDPRLVREVDAVNGALDSLGQTTVTTTTQSTNAFRTGVRVNGVNVCGYLRNESGLGAAVRGYIRALQSLHVPTALKDLSDLSPLRAEDPTLRNFDATHPYDVNLLCVNADQHFVVMSHLGEEFFQGRYNIGIWAWELPSFPVEWHDRFAYYDEIWVGTSFIANTLAPISPIPVVRVPPVLTLRATGSRDEGRRRIGARADDFVYLFIFDFRSYFERKNPLAVIDAFKKAFAPSERARLVIKCVNPEMDPDAFAAMEERAQGHPISIFSGYWAADRMRDLMAACDAYVSLHRSEGTGLTITDAMASGKPVIATAWSGDMDFMTVANSFPVRYQLIALDEDVGPYRAGEIWADPDVEHAAELMRYVFENRDEANARGAVAKRDIEANFSDEKLAVIVRQRLDAIAQRQRQRILTPAAPSVTVAGNASLGMPSSEQLPMHRRAPEVPPMDLRSSIHGPIGRLGKQLVSFLLSYHTYYQRNVNLSFSSFMRELAGAHEELAGRLEELTARLDALEQVARSAESRANAVSQAVEAQAAQLERLAADVAHLGYRFAARPYMATDAFGALGDLKQPMGYALDAATAAGSPGPRGFADLFRGAEEFIAERQRIYLQFFRGRANVVDLGCGRGEFLGLLAEEGIEAVGVEIDSSLVRYCQEKGLKVVEADALEYLRGLPEGSLDGIFSAQVIEHLESSQLTELLALARSRLRKGGVFIAETVNPESFEALKSFHVDPTHQRPIFPQVLLYRCREAGFPTARIFYPVSGGFTQECYQTAGEYAVIAVA